MAETYLWEEEEKTSRTSSSKGAGKHAATLLAQEAQLAGEAAEEARKNREARAATGAGPAPGVSAPGEFAGEKQVASADFEQRLKDRNPEAAAPQPPTLAI
eukprot:Skav221850  [mRNA]  locus=scaffold1175:28235:36714:+ [translate_table: standard]